jgi:hypothetical protein
VLLVVGEFGSGVARFGHRVTFSGQDLRLLGG